MFFFCAPKTYENTRRTQIQKKPRKIKEPKKLNQKKQKKTGDDFIQSENETLRQSKEIPEWYPKVENENSGDPDWMKVEIGKHKNVDGRLAICHELFNDCRALNSKFQNEMKKLALEFENLRNQSLECKECHRRCMYFEAPIKKISRAIDKLEEDYITCPPPRALQLLDIVRCQIV